MRNARRWTGSKDRGTRTYTDAEWERVTAVLARADRVDTALGIDEIVDETGVKSRTVRAILSDIDGLPHAIALTEDQRVYVAQWREEVLRHCRTIAAQIHSLQERNARRYAAAARLPLRQGQFWE